MARKGITKTNIRRELGLNFRQAEQGIGFLLAKGHIQTESCGGCATVLFTTLKGYRLLYFISIVYRELAPFFPRRKGRSFGGERETEVENALTEMLFNLRASQVLSEASFSEWSEFKSRKTQTGTST